jgi:hypothetical protein
MLLGCELLVPGLAAARIPTTALTMQGDALTLKRQAVDFHPELSRVFHRELSHL